VLPYEVHGRGNGGPPLLLICPLGCSMLLWGEFRSLLAQRFEVISYDHAGRDGLGSARSSTKALAEDATRVLDQLQVARAQVFGISLGGMAATWLAIKEPDRVARLCLACAPALGLELSHTSFRRQLALSGCFLKPKREVEAGMTLRLLSKTFRRTHPQEVLRIEQLLLQAPSNRRTLGRHLLAGFRHNTLGELDRISAPTLVLAGDEDALLGVDPPRRLAEGIRGAAFHVVASSGHAITLEQPAATATFVARFLDPLKAEPFPARNA
jgi:pimeloyl-ACP methyl ester carboxylesterase